MDGHAQGPDQRPRTSPDPSDGKTDERDGGCGRADARGQGPPPEHLLRQHGVHGPARPDARFTIAQVTITHQSAAGSAYWIGELDPGLQLRLDENVRLVSELRPALEQLLRL